MGVTAAPRSVSDATRFTASTPQPASKATTNPRSRFAPSSGSGASGSQQPPPPAGGHGTIAETADQRVSRLRAAHLAARRVKVSWFDRWIVGSRSVFDSAHRITVIGLIGLTAITGLLTAYTAADMYMFNRKRKAEFREKMRQMEEGSLEAARIAYMTNKATEEQIALVEEANTRAAAAGNVAFKLPNLLGPPSKIAGNDASSPSSTTATAASTPSVEITSLANGTTATSAVTPAQPSRWRFWASSALSKAEDGDSPGSAQRRLGYESLSGEDDGVGVRESDMLRAIEEKQAYVREKAEAAMERERVNQRSGGPLDRVGLDAGSNAPEPPKRSGWLWQR